MNETSHQFSDRSSLPSPTDAWDLLPQSHWDRTAARHLLVRAGWSAPGNEVDRAFSAGLTATLNRLFPETPAAFPKPKLVAKAEEDAPNYIERVKGKPETERRRSNAKNGSAHSKL